MARSLREIDFTNLFTAWVSCITCTSGTTTRAKILAGSWRVFTLQTFLQIKLCKLGILHLSIQWNEATFTQNHDYIQQCDIISVTYQIIKLRSFIHYNTQYNPRYYPNHEWLAVEEGSGDIEKMIKSSKSPYKTRFKLTVLFTACKRF